MLRRTSLCCFLYVNSPNSLKGHQDLKSDFSVAASNAQNGKIHHGDRVTEQKNIDNRWADRSRDPLRTVIVSFLNLSLCLRTSVVDFDLPARH